MTVIERHLDALHLNTILNDPYVRPDVAEPGDHPLDLTNAVANQNNYCLMAEFGGCMFFNLMPGVYEVHTQSLASGRGEYMKEVVRNCADWMFGKTDAFEIVTRIPAHHMGAKGLAQSVGMRLEFRRPNACVWRGQKMDVDIYSFRIQDWMPGEAIEERGRQFHDFLHAEATRIGHKGKPHPDDPVHNRYVGAALEMLESGHVRKAVAFYNRWCLIARHPIVQLLSESPLLIRFDLGLLRIEGEKMWVEPTQ